MGRSRDSVGFIVARLRAEEPGVLISEGIRELPLFPKRTSRLRSPSSLIFNGCRGYFPRVKRLGREVDHSVPLNGEVKNEWHYTSTPLYAVLLWTGITSNAWWLLYVPIKQSVQRHFICVLHMILTVTSDYFTLHCSQIGPSN